MKLGDVMTGIVVGWEKEVVFPVVLEHIWPFNNIAMRALYEAGYRVPEDVAVVGFDDIEAGRFATPSLTTIAPDKEMIASIAVSFLLERINGTRTDQPQRVEVPFRLIVRESTAGRSTSDASPSQG